jgi:hypothetical protein
LAAFVALLLIHLHFPEAGSLKAKRRELSSLKAQLQGRLGATVSEVDHQDTWQRATLAAAVTAGTHHGVEAAADRVQRFLDARAPEGVRVERTIASFEELR